MIHPRDQWYRIYVFTPGKAGPVLVGEAPKNGEPDTRKIETRWIEPPKWGPESETEHVHHPDSYHPDLRVRIAHHRGVLRQGFTVAACGHEHDPRMRFIETEGKPVKPCKGCVRATEAAKDEHARALSELEAKAAEKKRERVKVPEGPEADKVDP